MRLTVKAHRNLDYQIISDEALKLACNTAKNKPVLNETGDKVIGIIEGAKFVGDELYFDINIFNALGVAPEYLKDNEGNYSLNSIAFKKD